VSTSEEHKQREHDLYLPFWTLPWLRQKMIEMLAERDGTKRIAKMPTIPEWATRGFLSQNFLSSSSLSLKNYNQMHQKLNSKSSNLMWSKNR
jgi:hypothetical protein